MHLNIQMFIHHYGYAGIFAALFFEVIGIPFPAETTLTLAGFEWTKGVFSLVPLLVVAAMGNIIGSSIAYAVGYFLGRPVILRYGKYVGITEARLNRADQKFGRYRVSVVLFSKFIAGIRVLVPYLAGLNRMSFLLFTLYNAISAFAWTAAFIVLGKYIGVGWARYHHLFYRFLVPAIVAGVLIVGVAIVLRIRKKRRIAKFYDTSQTYTLEG